MDAVMPAVGPSIAPSAAAGASTSASTHSMRLRSRAVAKRHVGPEERRSARTRSAIALRHKKRSDTANRARGLEAFRALIQTARCAASPVEGATSPVEGAERAVEGAARARIARSMSRAWKRRRVNDNCPITMEPLGSSGPTFWRVTGSGRHVVGVDASAMSETVRVTGASKCPLTAEELTPGDVERLHEISPFFGTDSEWDGDVLGWLDVQRADRMQQRARDMAEDLLMDDISGGVMRCLELCERVPVERIYDSIGEDSTLMVTTRTAVTRYVARERMFAVSTMLGVVNRTMSNAFTSAARVNARRAVATAFAAAKRVTLEATRPSAGRIYEQTHLVILSSMLSCATSNMQRFGVFATTF